MKVNDKKVREKVIDIAIECCESVKSINRLCSKVNFYAVVIRRDVDTPFIWRLQDEFECDRVKICSSEKAVEVVFNVTNVKYFD